ncbi:hypothetical protein [Megasphaera sp.]
MVEIFVRGPFFARFSSESDAAACELRPAGPSALKFDERLFARPIGPKLH